MTNITPRELRQQLVMSMLFSKGDLYQEQERQRASAADCIEELEAKLATARDDALREAALLCTIEADKYIERDEFKSSYSATQCAKAILALT